MWLWPPPRAWRPWSWRCGDALLHPSADPCNRAAIECGAIACLLWPVTSCIEMFSAVAGGRKAGDAGRDPSLLFVFENMILLKAVLCS